MNAGGTQVAQGAAAGSGGLLARVSLCISGFKSTSTLRIVLDDWFTFLGGRPGEVVYVDGGSPLPDLRRLAALVHAGYITRLEAISPTSWENDFHRCYIQEYQSGRIATGEYLVFVKPDMLPLRRGRDAWLAEDLRKLDEPSVFSITNAHLIDPPLRREHGYDLHQFASLNFAIMKRQRFHDAMQAMAGEFIASDFRGLYPPHIRSEDRYKRALVEWCWAQYCEQQGLFTLARPESRDWMIFHINKQGRKLLQIRAAMHRGDGVEAQFDKPKGLYRPPPGGLKRFGQGIENAIRRMKGK